MDKCSKRIASSKVFDELVKLIGHDDVLQTSMFLKVFGTDDFSQDFLDWYAENNKNAEVPSIETKNVNQAKKIAKAAFNYYYHNRPSVDSTTRVNDNNDYITRFGYNNIFDREAGKRHIGTIILDIFNNIQNNNINLTGDKYKYYLNKAKKAWLDLIFESAAKVSELDIDSIKLGYENTQDKLAYLESLLGGIDKSISDSNLLAVYKELFASDETSFNYINELFADTRLQDVHKQVRNDLEAETTRLAANASSDENKSNTEGVNPEDDVDLDTTIITLNNHIGVYTSFMTHVGPRIRNYFNTLRKLATPYVGDLDTNNSFGIADTMDANACSSMLYNNGDFHNITTMIESIEKIGKTIAGFEAFVQLAKDLRSNADFATEMFTVFAKTKMAKLETRVENGVATTRISNFRANPLSAFTFDLRNDIKASVIDNNPDIMLGVIERINQTAIIAENSAKASKNKRNTKEDREKDLEAAKKHINNLKYKVVKLVKAYYPSIQEAAITSYIELNNNASSDIETQIQNARDLISDIETTIEKSVISKQAYNKMLAKAAEIKDFNARLTHDRNKGIWHFPSEYKDSKSVYAEDYISAQDASIVSIVNKLLPYSVIETDLNSRNIHGNNNSDIINNSMITTISKMLDDTYKEDVFDNNGKKIGTRLRNKTLEAWGLKKLRSNQYKYSNILLVQKDANGNPLNKALFEYIDGQLCITEDAEELIKFRLFNGSSDMDSGSNVSYNEMTTGDYLPTDFLNFFKDEDKRIPNVANYFLRIPSDAPKTFTIRAPKYDTTGLFTVENKDTFIETVNDIVNEYAPIITVEDYNSLYRAKSDNFYYSKLNKEYIKNFLLPNDDIMITDMQAIKEIPGTKQENDSYDGYVTFLSEEDGTTIVLKGTIEKVGKGHKLTNASLVGVVNKNPKTGKISDKLPDNIYNILSDKFAKDLRKHDVVIGDKTWNKTKLTLDTTHPVYQMIKNQFRQEMLDAATALSHYFNLVPKTDKNGNTYYVVELDDKNQPVFRPGMSNKKGYKFYHLGESGTVVEKNGKGAKLGGNVFHSNKFTLPIMVDGKIIKENYLDKIIVNNITSKDDGTINLLYGGAMQIIATEDEQGNKTVTDVKFSELQEAKIDEALTNFLNEYREQAINQVDKYKDFIPDVTVSDDNITEFAINNLLMHYVYDELLEGNVKFYKDSQTVLKRAKEYQGSGVPYGIADYTANHEDDLSDIKGAFLNDGTIEEQEKETIVNEKGKTVTRVKKDENGNPISVTIKIQDIFKGTLFEGTTQRRGFRAVTIKNSVRTNTKALDELVEKLVNQGLSRDHAMDILYGPVVIKNGKPELNEDGSQKRKGGFTETKVNDAQSYITVQEWVRRMAARGQLQRYLPLIKELIKADKDPNYKLTKDVIKEFVQVQKNFYYDQYYDERYGIYVPRQIKNAEFVLVPSLIKGTQLEQVYNIMREGNIDQLNTVETSKASNEDVLTVWDNNGDIPGISDEADVQKMAEAVKAKAVELNAAAQIYSYNNLYTQQETPQHMNAKNKAGIQLLKKIVDNLPNDNSKLGLLKKEFFKVFSQNIEESYFDLLDEFEIPRDENGNIKLDENGDIEGINMAVFYNKLKEEMMRTGLDSNLMDYVSIPQDSSTPLMPSYMNNIITKFESVVQSLFNTYITRQTLPGFHGAQITNIGWKSISAQGIDTVAYGKTYGKELRYHPNGEGYIEVMLPASFLGIDKNSEHYKNMTDEDILKEIEKEGLDMIIGYRIPTEGKQSVCNMKVVGFTDDATGSTIVVPDDWVSQTGSDFDIDSVYGIQYESYSTKDGQIKRVKYKTKMSEYDWFNYVCRFADKELDSNVKGPIAKAKSAIQEEYNNIYKTLQEEETEIWKSFTDKQQEALKNNQYVISKKIKKQGLEGKEAYRYRISEFNKFLKSTLARQKNKTSEFSINITKFIDKLNEIDTFLSNQTEEYNEAVIKRIQDILDTRKDIFEKAAKEAGLMSMDEFMMSDNIEKANSRQARNTRILEIMQEILKDPASLEENLSRSNYDDYIYARNLVMNDNMAAARAARSPYNVFDQIAYQEEAMSGAKLKAMSVTLDTFCSVCNKVQPILEEPVYVVYDTKYIKNPQEALDRFDGEDYKEGAKTFSIRHNKYGWSKDNRNVAGKILTAYSSQTTAYILDAIKEGSIPNVNDFTFAAFKTLANIGCDYITAVSFIMQPGITEIVNAYNTTKSVFATTQGNAIHLAIRNIAKKLGIRADNNVPITTVLASLNKTYGKKFNKIFKQKGDKDITISLKREDIEDLPIIVSKLVNRLKKQRNYDTNTSIKEIQQIPHNTYKGLISENDDAVFVFGSNPLGINGNPIKGTGGAALVALKQGRVQQGEKMDNILSSNGRSYGLTTVKAPNARNNKENQLSIEEITDNIKKLYKHASSNSDKIYKIAYTDTKLLNGHTIKEIVEAFIKAGPIPNNIQFHESLDKYFTKTELNDEFENEILFDLGVILAFNKLHETANTIGNIVNCCNPDKFGAKQTIFETRKVFENIDKAIFNREEVPNLSGDRTENGQQTTLKVQRKPVLSVNGNHILEAIYPGVSNPTYDTEALIKAIMQNNDIQSSAYPSLFAFLKYASATSTIIAKKVFDTQDDAFVKLVSNFKSVLSGYNPDISEETYVDLQKYILSSIYKNVSSIKYGVTVRLENGNIKIDKKDSGTEEEKRLNAKAETARIYGYEHSANISVINRVPYETKSGETRTKAVITPFTVKDINNPTKEEMELFEQLSPAQKVQWIKTNFSNPGIFGLLNVSLFNNAARGRWIGMQTIEYREQNLNTNVVYGEFRKAFFNNNPIIVSAAIDLVKYAVQVEGLRMSATAINKVIDNDCLINSFGQNGLGFIDEIKAVMSDIKSSKGIYSSIDTVEQLYENYLRSHPNFKGIRTVYLSKKNQAKYGLYKHDFGTYYLKKDEGKENYEENTKAFNQRMENAGIKYYLPLSDMYVTNSYIRLADDKGSNLYRIKDYGEYIILYPLTNLEVNENAEWSANEANNEGFLSKQAYEILCTDYAVSNKELDFTHKFIKDRMDYYKETGEKKTFFYSRRKDYNTLVPSVPFNLENLAEEGNTMYSLLEEIINHFSKNNNERLFIKNRELEDYIFSPGVEYGSIQKIKIGTNDTRKFVLFIPEDINAYEEFYLKGDKEGNLGDANAIKNPSFKRIIKNAQDAKLKFLNGLVEVVDISEEEAFAATLEELDSEFIDFAMARRASENDELAVSYLEKLRSNDVTVEVSSIENKKVFTTRETAKYAKHTADYIKRVLFNQFVQEPGTVDSYLSITDDRVIAMIKEDPALMDKYMKAINMAQGFLNKVSMFDEFEVKSEDTDVKTYIEDIKKALDEVKKLPINEVLVRGMQAIVDSQSTNPTIKDGLIDVMDGYWRTYGGMWQFHDLMENGTPILQVIMKDVMGDLDAKQKNFHHKVRKEYWNKIREIQAEAARRGEIIRWDYIVDEDGRFIQDYSSKFIDDLNTLRKEANDAARVHNYGSIKHLEALLKYNKFKALHCNQEANPKYYIEKVKAEEEILNSYPELYSEYMKLYYERLDIYNYMSEDGLDDEQRKRLKEIQQQMFNLYRPGVYEENGELKERPIKEDNITYSPEEEKRISLYGRAASDKLRELIDKVAALNDQYFQYDPSYGFEDQLRINLNIIESFERRDANGIPTKPQDWLDAQPEYVAAKDWVRNNARFKVKLKYDEQGKPLTIGAKIQAALKRLAQGGNGKNQEVNKICREHNNNEGIYDDHQIPDARKLSAKEIEDIKTAQENNMQTVGCPPLTDRILISNARPANAVYNTVFYDRMRLKNGDINIEYLRVVTELNKLLEPYVNNLDGIVHLELIPDTKEGIDILNEIAIKYQELRALKRVDNADNAEEVSDFIKENVEFVTNEAIWNAQVLASQNKSAEFKNAWINVSYERKPDGSFVKRNGEFVPNRFLYSYAKPKGNPGESNYERYVDHQRQEDINLIKQTYRKVPTRYYYQAMNEAMSKATSDPNYDYREWYVANHIYNPYTRKMEPLDCWLTTEVRDELFKDNIFEGEWQPRSNQRDKKVRDGNIVTVLEDEKFEYYDESRDMRNHNYNPDLGLAGNWAKESPHNKEYINPKGLEMTESEKQMRDYLQKVLMETANVESARRFFKEGYLPRAMKAKETDIKLIGKEFAKLFGFGISTENGKKEWYKEIGYENDRTPLMPMTKILDNKQTIDLANKIKTLKEKEITRKQFNTDAEFEKAVNENTELINKYEEDLRKQRNALQNRDWLNVIDAYLEQAQRYNAIQENKQKLYFLLNALRNMKMYSRMYGGSGDLKANTRKSKKGDVLEQTIDENLIKQYENQLRRLLFDQWKEAEGNATKLANTLQGFTSANYMMLNFKGGIANVTLGETGIIAEAAAKEYFSKNDWGFGTGEWLKGSIGFARGGYEAMFNNNNISYNKQDAIIKFMNVVDYDEVTGVSRELNLEQASKKIRDFMFSPQTITEHFMQNSVLFAMMHSHKLVTDENGETVYMSEREYIDMRLSQELYTVLDEKQQTTLAEFKKELKKDKNKLKDYAWFRRNSLTDFIYLHCSNDQVNKFIEIRKKQEERFKQEFKEKLSLYDQVELGKDGTLAFKDNTDLAELDKIPSKSSPDMSKAIELLGKFAEKTRKVNDKIHGVYNRQGAAYIERKWYGSLIMQYHKHLPMGLLKRYMRRGHWNETRGSVDKGMATSIYDLLRLNYDKIKVDAGLTNEQTDTLKSFAFLIGHSFDYLQQLKTTWDIIPSYERANIMRNLGDVVGTVGALMTVAALWYIADDDKEMQDSLWFNMALYEADRLASEAFMYNPIGAISETKKLMSTPIAAQSIITDAASSLKAIADWALDDEYDPYYHSGRFAGEHKLSVYFQRRIPIWNGIRSVLDTPSNNHYYKLGVTPLSLFDVKEMVTGKN